MIESLRLSTPFFGTVVLKLRQINRPSWLGGTGYNSITYLSTDTEYNAKGPDTECNANFEVLLIKMNCCSAAKGQKVYEGRHKDKNGAPKKSYKATNKPYYLQGQQVKVYA